ncbi:MAG TPA: cytochrome c oxidase subunit 3 family protein [Luteitalea sp.]|nr:cytochrome c oxidase subunit 3 family protein [Luteitalea sp.]
MANGSHAHAAHHPMLQHHFDTLEQQQNASLLGMWMFLVTEVLFFGGLFMAYILYRWLYNASFHEASHELNVWLGLFNTAVLIGSSLTMALAVRASKTGEKSQLVLFLILTLVLGGIFLGVKVVEYAEKFTHHLVPGEHFAFHDAALKDGAQIYFSLYFAMTGLHATHMILGGLVLLPIIVMAQRGWFSPEWYTPIELFGLYWHFVDIVWIFLFPLLYLM